MIECHVAQMHKREICVLEVLLLKCGRCLTENYYILSKYGDIILFSLIFLINPTMNLISEIYYKCER